MDADNINAPSEGERPCPEVGVSELCKSMDSQIEEPPADHALDPPQSGMSLVEAFRKYFGPESGVELDLSRDWLDRPPIDFSDFDE